VAVTYSAEQRQAAKKDDLKLVTLDAGGLSFQGGVTEQEYLELSRFILDFKEKQMKKVPATSETS